MCQQETKDPSKAGGKHISANAMQVPRVCIRVVAGAFANAPKVRLTGADPTSIHTVLRGTRR